MLCRFPGTLEDANMFTLMLHVLYNVCEDLSPFLDLAALLASGYKPFNSIIEKCVTMSSMRKALTIEETMEAMDANYRSSEFSKRSQTLIRAASSEWEGICLSLDNCIPIILPSLDLSM